MRRLMVVLAVLLGLSGLSFSAAAQEATPDQESTPAHIGSLLDSLELPELIIEATDDGLRIPSEIEAGRYHVIFVNGGQRDASLELYQVPEGSSFDELLAAFEAGTEETVPDIFYEIGINGGASAAPGAQAHVVIDFVAGDWAFNYYSFDEESGEDINIPTPVTVTGEAAPPAEIDADVTVEMFEMAFNMPDEVASGPAIWEVANTGEQPHFLLVASYPNEITEEEIMDAFEQDMAASMGTPAAEVAPNATPAVDFEQFGEGFETGVLSPGMTNWVEVNLEPGFYIAVCFVPDRETGIPHAMLGMIATFNVT